MTTPRSAEEIAREADKEFLCSFRHGGHEYGFSVYAVDAADAEVRLRSLKTNATVDGELMARISAVVPGAGLLARAAVWCRNLIWKPQP